LKEKDMKRMVRVFLVVGMVAALFSCATSPIVRPDVEHTLVILHTNDFHGHPVAFYDYPVDGQGGLPAQATLVEEVRAANPNVLVVSAGDINTGRPESNFFNARPDILGHNYIGYDLLAMGNHEFDPSPEEMQKQIAESGFPWLCANVVKEDGSYIDHVKPYIIKDYHDFKVAVIGLMTTETAESGTPAHIRGYRFLDEVEVASKLFQELKTKADIVLAVAHMGIYEDDSMGSRRLAKHVPGLALIVDGHTHTLLEEPIHVTDPETGRGTAIVQAGKWGLYVGKATLKFMNGEVTGLDWKPVPINVQKRETLADGSKVTKYVDKEIPPDATLAAMLQPYVDKVDGILNEKIGRAEMTFLNTDSRKKETPIGDLVADSMLWYVNSMNLGADFALQNGGGIRTGIPEGEIRKRTIYEVIPFDNTVMTVTLRGADLIDLFNQTPQAVGHGAMPQVSEGVSFVIDSAGGTVSEVTINGVPIDPEREYVVATNSYLAAGGDGYRVILKKVSEYDTSLMQRDALIEYILHLGGKIRPVEAGRFSIK
jgi:5'-nucleotidase/UDP-sugar diphosphatase